ncbi:SymE family type I addiction module toxin [Photorhabdus laumondii]|uniref:SymE family type I addiction module toxin n=1 Tax=Photorhabdus laumondii TaxID=2218628 RepID=UPI003314FF3B
MAGRDNKTIRRISQAERFGKAATNSISLKGKWLQEAGFTPGMPLKIRVMPDCIVITAQNTLELWQCLEGLSIEPFNPSAAVDWIKYYPGGLRLAV